MIRKRDGPASQGTTPGPGKDERAPPLPQLKVLHKPRAHPSPSHHRSRRRQEGPWRGFSVRLYAPLGSDGAHALHAFLRAMAKRYGLALGDIREIPGQKAHE
jgi:hypothetical protein